MLNTSLKADQNPTTPKTKSIQNILWLQFMLYKSEKCGEADPANVSGGMNSRTATSRNKASEQGEPVLTNIRRKSPKTHVLIISCYILIFRDFEFVIFMSCMP